MVCKGKQKTGHCEYNRNYRVDVLEEIVKKEIKQYLNTYKKIDLKIRLLKQRISYSENRLIELKKEVISALMSTNENNNKIINEKFNKENQNMKKLKEDFQKLEEKIDNDNIKIKQLKEYIPNWSTEFEESS